MGSISFMDKYNPDQFDIVGLSMKAGFGLESNRFYDSYKEVKQDGTPTGSSGKKLMTMLVGKLRITIWMNMGTLLIRFMTDSLL